MDKTTIELTCPGSEKNYTVIVSTAWQSRFGLGNPRNIGDCALFIVPLDAQGKPINKGDLNVMLSAGQQLKWYYPPPEAAQIAAVCSKACTGGGQAILEFDTPVS
ncbi:MAG: hypothetical protein M3384_15395 [Acidobacteriota bacterium]|nr:hypothetical protein [Acidobacteriota bacterium]